MNISVRIANVIFYKARPQLSWFSFNYIYNIISVMLIAKFVSEILRLKTITFFYLFFLSANSNIITLWILPMSAIN